MKGAARGDPSRTASSKARGNLGGPGVAQPFIARSVRKTTVSGNRYGASRPRLCARDVAHEITGPVESATFRGRALLVKPVLGARCLEQARPDGHRDVGFNKARKEISMSGFH